MKKVLLLISACLIGLLLFFLVTEKDNKQNKHARKAKEIAVVTGIVETESLAKPITIIGKLKASRNVEIAPQIAGKIASIHFDDNQKVNKGQLLIKLDDAKAKANLAEAKALLADEKRKLKEFKKLINSNAITQTQIDAQNALVSIAEAKVAATKAELSYYSLSAPFDGYTGLKNFSEGKMVAAGNELVSLDDLSVMYLDLPIPEQYLSKLHLGMTISATSKAWPEVFNGKLVAISPRVNENTLNLSVRIAFENPELKLKPGMMVSTKAKLPPISMAAIPVQALEYSGTKRFVYRIDQQNIAKRTEVILQERIGDRVLVQQGLLPGDKIVVQGLVNMRDGLKIKDIHQTLATTKPSGDKF